MAQGTVHEGRISHRGFASMNTERSGRLRAWVARRYRTRSAASRRTGGWRQRRAQGGQSVPGAKRSFSQNRALAAVAGARVDRVCLTRSAASLSIRSLRPRRVARADRQATEAAARPDDPVQGLKPTDDASGGAARAAPPMCSAHKERRRIGLICSTPSLANIAISAANAADISARAIDPKVASDYFHGELGEPGRG